jgi:hypothetical protein
MGLLTFTVQVESATYDALHRGETAETVSIVIVSAANPQEAQLIAAQIAASRGRMPTRTVWLVSTTHRDDSPLSVTM